VGRAEARDAFYGWNARGLVAASVSPRSPLSQGSSVKPVLIVRRVGLTSATRVLVVLSLKWWDGRKQKVPSTTSVLDVDFCT
jgi:hypothetical protein